jgi:hypothetical protein
MMSIGFVLSLANKKETMKQQDVSRIAVVINTIYNNSLGKMISVKEFPMTPIFKENKFYATEQAQILEYMKERLITVIGERAGMKYMWKGEMPDTNKIALEIIKHCDADNKNKSKNIKDAKAKLTKVEKPKELTKRFVEKIAGDMGYVLYMDQIYEAYIYKVSKYPKIKAAYEVLITYGGKNCIVANVPIFPSITILCNFLVQTNHVFNMNAPLEENIEEFNEVAIEMPEQEMVPELILGNL